MSTRDDLVEATRELLWERGYGATSPRAILDVAGAGQGSMYHHFRGKEALAQEAIERNAEEMREQITTDLASGSSAVEHLRAYLVRQREVLKGCQFGRLAQDADVVGSPALRGAVEEMFGWIRAQLAAVIAAGVESGEFRAGLDAAKTAATVAATLQGAYVLARSAQDVAVFDDAVEGVLALLTAARA
ncbi:TetR/AcrR family transcriptional regulator [Amycolatopsis jiangsuensis]|uniref:AcrR family transcriptional regulator n=1 Tax=Amycolatopsis jiangsuensis TaxID=1181879 RepID=A0A840J2W7_9PSEU|nr:TetR/AcrR family transcriptional regulator [Amycolatopsis jiangsuensis]MBB4688069.1 AcrR family transcriptional regulator [Amycolatopsis jiangsuensis]